jgi:LuxR family transcriptional regulator of csgAB operon
MSAEASTAEARPFAPRRSVILVGPESLQNRLLAGLIEQRSGCNCLLRSAAGLEGFPFASNALALLDIEGLSAPEISAQLRALSARASCSIAVINADEGAAFAEIVTWPGLKGVFFSDSSQENLVKGIQAIFNGDYWLPRKILCEHLERTRVALRPAVSSEAINLTRKEIETLKLLASGNSTLYIASKLNVSPHTVKSHIYNLFRKIRVSNRVQAAQWAMQYIDGVEPMSR